MSRNLEDLYDAFGITRYHANGIYGQNVKLMIIDTGCSSNKIHNVHGLAVSLILQDPSKKILSILPESEVLIYDVVNPADIPIQLVLDSLQKAIDLNVDIISISLGSGEPWDPLQRLIDIAFEKGILVFSAAGNSSSQGYEFPSACVHAISVASMNSSRQPSPFNTRNDAVVVFAPGEEIKLPTGENGKLEEFSGTSFSTPFAAGLAALILSQHRFQQNDFKKRIPRKTMIEILRDPNHLNLNCKDHSYVMENICVDYPSFTVEQKPKSTITLNIGLLFLFLLGISMYTLLHSSMLKV